MVIEFIPLRHCRCPGRGRPLCGVIRVDIFIYRGQSPYKRVQHLWDSPGNVRSEALAASPACGGTSSACRVIILVQSVVVLGVYGGGLRTRGIMSVAGKVLTLRVCVTVPRLSLISSPSFRSERILGQSERRLPEEMGEPSYGTGVFTVQYARGMGLWIGNSW